MTQTITFKNGTTLSVIAVYSQKDLIQGAYRECFEIRIPTEATTYNNLSALATPENLSELILTETDNKANSETAIYTHYNFTLVTGMGMKTAPEDGTKYLYLSISQKSDAELAIERISQENEAMKDAIFELAEIVAGAGEEE